MTTSLLERINYEPKTLESIHSHCPDKPFIAEAICRAEDAGYLPAEGQREVDWTEVALWAKRVQAPGFRWLPEAEQAGTAYIIMGANGAIASGQHRILGGLMGGNPVPPCSCSLLTVDLPTQPWRRI